MHPDLNSRIQQLEIKSSLLLHLQSTISSNTNLLGQLPLNRYAVTFFSRDALAEFPAYLLTILLKNITAGLLGYILAVLFRKNLAGFKRVVTAVFLGYHLATFPRNLFTVLLRNLLVVLLGNLVAGFFKNLAASFLRCLLAAFVRTLFLVGCCAFLLIRGRTLLFIRGRTQIFRGSFALLFVRNQTASLLLRSTKFFMTCAAFFKILGAASLLHPRCTLLKLHSVTISLIRGAALLLVHSHSLVLCMTVLGWSRSFRHVSPTNSRYQNCYN